jgi:hypothetical protein
MKKLLTSTAVACLLGAAPAFAIDANTAVGIGVGVSNSTAVSNSSALAVGGGLGIGVGGNATSNATGGNATATGGNAAGGRGGNGGNVVLGRGAVAPSATINSNVPAHQSITTVPSVFAPGLAAAGIESCLGSVSGGGSFLGTGITLGGSIPDTGCNARLDARTLWSFGLRKAAVARLCLSSEIQSSMPDVCGRYLPRPAYPAFAPAYVPAVQTAGLLPGQVWLVNGKTHANQICSDYDEPHKHCRRWAR